MGPLPCYRCLRGVGPLRKPGCLPVKGPLQSNGLLYFHGPLRSRWVSGRQWPVRSIQSDVSVYSGPLQKLGCLTLNDRFLDMVAYISVIRYAQLGCLTLNGPLP